METDTIRTQYGVFTIDKNRDKKMANALQKSKYFNEELLTTARKFVNENSIVVDIGAHIGTFAIPISKEVERVTAFEPSREAFVLLSRNASENNAPLQLVNKALGSEKGSGTLVVRNASNAGANTLIPGGDIPVTTLDDEVAHADFIKIDVEGMELKVLLGGTRLIESARPVMLFEVNLSQLRAHGTSSSALERFFTQRGYNIYFSLKPRYGALARVNSVTLLTALIAPRSWLFFGDSAPFDLVAVPKERPLSFRQVGFLRAIRQVISDNIALKIKRITAYFQ